MKKRAAQNQLTKRDGHFTESQKKFIREFARETAIAAREIWQGIQQIQPDELALMSPGELEELSKAFEEPRPRDHRGRFMSRNSR
jgi:hypothetical protein